MWNRARPNEWDGKPDADDDGLGDECDAYLRGEWAEYLRARGYAVPRWAWLNRVAHAPEQALRLTQRDRVWCGRHEDDWTEFQSSLADLLLKQADDTGRTVEEIQASVLVPIELALFARDDSHLPADAILLVRILAALRDPSERPGPSVD